MGMAACSTNWTCDEPIVNSPSTLVITTSWVCGEDMYFIDMRLPFGLRSAPQACQRITDAVRYMHLRDGYHLVNYLDDFCGVSSPERASAGFSALRSLLQELGLDEAYEKAVSPTTRLTFIGLEVDTIAMTVSVPEDKLCDLESILNKWQNKRRCTKRQLQSLIGKLSFVATCIPPGRIFMSRLLQMLRLLYRQHHHAHLTQNFRKDIQWWQTFLRSYNGISLILEDNTTPVPDAIVASDACLTGCGGVSGHEYFHRTFPISITSNSSMKIHHLELLTVLICCRTWAPLWSRKTVHIYCDNIASVYVINGSRSKDGYLNACARALWFLQATQDFKLFTLVAWTIGCRINSPAGIYTNATERNSSP
ncbi:hypothetical protein QZH41_003228 [Actinostola sp. cb2023]|nr:hypothetical protein QZH41_003228 [Actinostola sp. cb2023]